MAGYIQVYTGDGKGKTTAALGLALRAAGHGLKTYIGQFMKGQHYGELAALRDHPWITIEQYGDTDCVRQEDINPKHIEQARQGLVKANAAMSSGAYDILILDEVNVAIGFGLISVKEVLDILKDRPKNVEVVLTGRYAPKELLDTADLVSEMKEVKHYFQKGVLARNGIEK